MQAKAITALITPYDTKGAVDIEALDRLIASQVKGKSDGILLAGSTGEGSLLTFEEKLAIFHRAVEQAEGLVEVVANVGTCSTQESVDLAKDAKNLGVNSLMAIVPYAVRPTPQGCRRHFEAIASVGLPLIVYHHPGRSGMCLPLASLLEIAAIEGVIGIKECSGDPLLVEQLVKEGIVVYSGDDLLLPSQLRRGVYGSISTAGNIVPDQWKGVIKTQSLSLELERLVRALALETNPQCVKYAASLLGLCLPYMRLPLIEPSEASKQAISECLSPFFSGATT